MFQSVYVERKVVFIYTVGIYFIRECKKESRVLCQILVKFIAQNYVLLLENFAYINYYNFIAALK